MRLQEFALSLHPDKTRLIEFGRHAADRRAKVGLGKPETFRFLGFVFICGKTRRGKFLVHRKSRRDRMRAKLKEVKKELRRRMHQPIPEQGRWLAQVVRGYFAYHAVPTNGLKSALSATMWWCSGYARSGVEVRKTASRGNGSNDWPTTGFLNLAPFTPGRARASPSNTRGKNRMP